MKKKVKDEKNLSRFLGILKYEIEPEWWGEFEVNPTWLLQMYTGTHRCLPRTTALISGRWCQPSARATLPLMLVMQRGAGREAPYANENGDLTREIRRENWVAAWRRARSLPRRGKVKGRMIKQAGCRIHQSAQGFETRGWRSSFDARNSLAFGFAALGSGSDERE